MESAEVGVETTGTRCRSAIRILKSFVWCACTGLKPKISFLTIAMFQPRAERRVIERSETTKQSFLRWGGHLARHSWTGDPARHRQGYPINGDCFELALSQ